jgi:hypothetical protein
VSERAPAGPSDGIVVIELTINDRDEIPDVVACLHAGAAAWLNTPFSSAVDEASRLRRVGKVQMIAAEISDEARRVRNVREEHYRAQAKADEKLHRQVARARKAGRARDREQP